MRLCVRHLRVHLDTYGSYSCWIFVAIVSSLGIGDLGGALNRNLMCCGKHSDPFQ